MGKLENKKVAVLATDGFEQSELEKPVEALRDAGGQGDIGSLQNFMTQLAGFNRLITFDTIDYTRVGKIDATFRMTIRGKTYLKTAQ